MLTVFEKFSFNDKRPIREFHRKMQMRFNQLVQEGKITPAEAEAYLKPTFLKEDINALTREAVRLLRQRLNVAVPAGGIFEAVDSDFYNNYIIP